MADVTLNKVSELADVTKGAFFNHFDSKETLVTELMQMLLTRLDKQFDRLMAEEENSDGCFTRAYITLGSHSPKVQLNVKVGARS
jgi:AcrR family transcriptional regulator